jgi:exodeoxyribonuclease-3
VASGSRNNASLSLAERRVKIVTWNVNSLKARHDYVERYLDAASPDVLCLQELKLQDHAVPRALFESRGYALAIHGQKQYNGVLIASRVGLEDVRVGLPEGDDGMARFVSAVTGGVRLVNLYCPQGQRVDSPQFPYKLAFFRALRRWLDRHCDPTEELAVVGDLNIARHPEDIWDPEGFADIPTFHPKEHERWDELVDFGLHDAVKPHIEPGKYSFWDYRGGAFYRNQGMRIDHVLVTESLRERVLTAWIDRPFRKKIGDLKASDHAPVGVELAP